MGSCLRTPLDDTTKCINQKLIQEERQQKRINKLLFLGPGGSGKSTIFKQLQWLHGGGFSKHDAIQLRQHIYAQIISQMIHLINYYSLYENIDEENKHDTELQKAISTLHNHGDISTFNTDLSDAIQYIWNNEEKVKNAFNDLTLSQYQILNETTEYLWNELDRIKASDYVPNESDIINVRCKTTGVIHKRFEIQRIQFKIFDVGGQKSERRKWINCFDGVNALVFVISMSCYNEMMYEDQHKNAMVDSLELFDETINSKYFVETHIILFLNKLDLFRKKIRKVPITLCPAFEDFEQYYDDMLSKYNINCDANDYEQATTYMKYKFELLNKSDVRHQIFAHLTTAMDRKNIDNVFNDVIHIIVGKAMTAHGFI